MAVTAAVRVMVSTMVPQCPRNGQAAAGPSVGPSSLTGVYGLRAAPHAVLHFVPGYIFFLRVTMTREQNSSIWTEVGEIPGKAHSTKQLPGAWPDMAAARSAAEAAP
jgi:hypothetical protein